MTEITAKEIFDMLIEKIRSNNFTDIGTFLIPQVNPENQFAKFNDSYTYVSTEKAIEDAIALSNSPQGSYSALLELVDASIKYFTAAYQIPDNFSNSLNQLDGLKGNREIYINTDNEQVVRLDTTIKTKEVSDLIRLLRGIKQNSEYDDETFFTRIANL